MTARQPSWQIMLADLSLILFVTALGGFDHADDLRDNPGLHGPPRGDALATAPAQAIYRPAPNATTFGQWLSMTAGDPRSRLTLHVSYEGENVQAGWAAAQSYLAEARRSGIEPRLVLESGRSAQVWASFAYDDVETDTVARARTPGALPPS